MRDLGYQGLLIVTFLGVAVAGLIYAKMIEPVLMSPAVTVEYWNFKIVDAIPEPESIDLTGVDSIHQMHLPFATLE